MLILTLPTLVSGPTFQPLRDTTAPNDAWTRNRAMDIMTSGPRWLSRTEIKVWKRVMAAVPASRSPDSMKRECWRSSGSALRP
ncbi:hypothetical protein DSECCO2_226070 [anaerobic digester metagenome]